MNSGYHLVVRQLHYRLKQDNFQNYCPNKYLRKVYWRKYAYRRLSSVLFASTSVWSISLMKYLRQSMTVFEHYTCDLELPKKLAGWTLYTPYCSMYRKKTCSFYIYCTKKSHRFFREAQCHCKLCVKDGPASLKSLWVNKLQVLYTT